MQFLQQQEAKDLLRAERPISGWQFDSQSVKQREFRKENSTL